MKHSVNRKKFLIQYAAYLFRWQLSTPILWPCVALLNGVLGASSTSTLIATTIANFIGGLIFFWVDRFIFTSRRMNPIWEVKSNAVCADCGAQVTRGYRLVSDLSLGYDRSGDENPQYRCESCSMKKYEQTRLHQIAQKEVHS